VATTQLEEFVARKVSVSMTDDIDGEPAAETVQFGLDGVSYEIDLSEDNAIDLRDMLYRYTEAGLKIGGRKAGRPSAGTGESAADQRARTQRVRAWARENGFSISDRGRVPSEVIDAFAAAEREEAEAPAPKRAVRAKVAAAATPAKRRKPASR
jgi:hypothetical protein